MDNMMVRKRFLLPQVRGIIKLVSQLLKKRKKRMGTLKTKKECENHLIPPKNQFLILRNLINILIIPNLIKIQNIIH